VVVEWNNSSATSQEPCCVLADQGPLSGAAQTETVFAPVGTQSKGRDKGQSFLKRREERSTKMKKKKKNN